MGPQSARSGLRLSGLWAWTSEALDELLVQQEVIDRAAKIDTGYLVLRIVIGAREERPSGYLRGESARKHNGGYAFLKKRPSVLSLHEAVRIVAVAQASARGKQFLKHQAIQSRWSPGLAPLRLALASFAQGAPQRASSLARLGPVDCARDR